MSHLSLTEVPPALGPPATTAAGATGSGRTQATQAVLIDLQAMLQRGASSTELQNWVSEQLQCSPSGQAGSVDVITPPTPSIPLVEVNAVAGGASVGSGSSHLNTSGFSGGLLLSAFRQSVGQQPTPAGGSPGSGAVDLGGRSGAVTSPASRSVQFAESKPSVVVYHHPPGTMQHGGSGGSPSSPSHFSSNPLEATDPHHRVAPVLSPSVVAGQARPARGGRAGRGGAGGLTTFTGAAADVGGGLAEATSMVEQYQLLQRPQSKCQMKEISAVLDQSFSRSVDRYSRSTTSPTKQKRKHSLAGGTPGSRTFTGWRSPGTGASPNSTPQGSSVAVQSPTKGTVAQVLPVGESGETRRANVLPADPNTAAVPLNEMDEPSSFYYQVHRLASMNASTVSGRKGCAPREMIVRARAQSYISLAGESSHLDDADDRAGMDTGERDSDADEASCTNCGFSCIADEAGAAEDELYFERLRRASVLDLSRSDLNGGMHPLRGVMPTFVLNGKAPGPRFSRQYARHTPVYAQPDTTRALLGSLGVPFIDCIDDVDKPFNVLDVVVAHGKDLFVHVCMNVLLRYHFCTRFGFDLSKLLSFVREAASFFRVGNPYHHPLHASDIVVSVHQWLSQSNAAPNFTDDELFAFLFAAVVMRVAHAGVDNRFLVETKHPFALVGSHASPQQGVTVALVFSLLEKPENHFLPVTTRTSAVVGAGGAIAGSNGRWSPTGEEEPSNNGSFVSLSESPALNSVAADCAPLHQWNQSREHYFYDVLTELVMATDERNHNVVKQGVARISEDNDRSHGCHCQRGGYHGAANGLSWSSSAVSQVRQHSRAPPLPCRHCCAYVTDAHVPTLLKAVLHFVDYSYLFRPYEIFTTGSCMFVAELYRQSELQGHLLMQREQAGDQPAELTSAAAHPTTSAEVGGAATKKKSVSAPSLTRMESAGVVAADDVEHQRVAATPAVLVENALLSEEPAWREDALRTSTLSALRTFRDMPSPIRKRTLNSGGPQLVDRLGSLLPPSEDAAKDNGSFEGSVPLLANTAAIMPRKSVETSSGGGGVVSTRPLQGYGRDIHLTALRDLYCPFLTDLEPYLPPSWVRAACENQRRFLDNLPTAAEFDAQVESLLQLSARPDDVTAQRARLQQDSGANNENDAMPLDLLRIYSPVRTDIGFDVDGHQSRVLREVLRGVDSRWRATVAATSACMAATGSSTNLRPHNETVMEAMGSAEADSKEERSYVTELVHRTSVGSVTAALK